jgi:hypothetical protein
MRQEIAGTADTMGQYEHHQSFCMPRLYRIVHVRCTPKFGCASPAWRLESQPDMG